MKIRHAWAVVLAMLALSSCASTPPMATPPTTERDAVLAVVQTLFDAMAAKDVEGARRVLIEGGRNHGISTVDGKIAIRSFSNADFLRQISAMAPRLRERIWAPEVRVHGPMATVWARYDLWMDDKLSHCGVDAFDLVRTADGWKIAGIVYTVERDGCDASPLGPLTP